MTILDLAKTLRKRLTRAESVMWKYLRARQQMDLKFRRQHKIGNYIVDFVCLEKRIVIELDGGQHNTEKEKDIERDTWFVSQGFKVLRFWNKDVLSNTRSVLEEIRKSCF